MNIAQLARDFLRRFGRPHTLAARAPGRVNLIGEHTDYNDGFVLPIAIDRSTIALAAPRKDSLVNLASASINTPAQFDLAAPIRPGQPSWANYCRGVAAGLSAAGLAGCGADILFASNVPIGGGLSSSASLEVATAFALLGLWNKLTAVSHADLARICQKAEHDFAGAPCGIMDQFIAIAGQSGRALLLDCRSTQIRQIPFDDPAAVLLVVDTKVKHSICDGGYAARRDQCYQAARLLHVPMLRDAGLDDVNRAATAGTITGKHLARARHVVGEIARTLQAAQALQSGDLAAFGLLMYASHRSLADDYEVSCEELDAVVRAASQCPGVYGARMTGGGFGGCAIVLAQAASANTLSAAITDQFSARFDHPPAIFATRACQGAQLLAE